MPLSFSDVEEILRIIDQFPVAEIRFEHGDVKLYVKRTSPNGPVAAPRPAETTAAAATESPSAPEVATTAPNAPKPPAPHVDRTGQIAIESPLTGVFYAAPSPASPPFVGPGKQVNEGDDLCIIEVMKLMNTIKAPCAGIVTDVVAENAVLVQRGEPVMWIKPFTGEA